VTSGQVDDLFKQNALAQQVYVFGPEDIAKMILENYGDISSVFLKKLQLTNQVIALK
jgi:hypothetical protein